MAVLLRFPSHPKTIYDCNKFICLILFILGCSGFNKREDRFKYNSKTLVYTCMVACWYIGSLLGCVYLKLRDPGVDNIDSLIKSIVYLEIGMSIFMYVTTVCCMLLNMKKNLKLYASIHELDSKLLQQFYCNLNYEKLLAKHILIFSIVIVIYIIVVFAAVSQGSHTQEYIVHLLAGLSYAAVTCGPHLNCYAQMNMAEILAIRFRLLQKLLTKKVVCSPKLTVRQQIDCLRRLIALLQQYRSCIKQINQVYAVCLASTLLHDFTLTTSQLYLNFGTNNTSEENTLIWYVSMCMLLPLYKMTLATIYCDRAVWECEKCFKMVIDTEVWFPQNMIVRQMISTNMLWRINNKTELLCGTMIFNKQMMIVVYSQIFNYVLILIQFRMTHELGEQIENQKNRIQEWIGVDYI